MKHIFLLAIIAFGLGGVVWSTNTVEAHPIDMTSVEFFVEEDWEGTLVAPNTMRGIHIVNWFEVLALIGAPDAATNVLDELAAYEGELFAYLEENLTVRNNGELCELTNLSLPEQTRDKVVIRGLLLPFDVACTEPVDTLSVTATFLVDKFPNQSNYIGVYRTPTELIADTTLTPDTTTWTLNTNEPAASGSVNEPSLPTITTSDQPTPTGSSAGYQPSWRTRIRSPYCWYWERYF